MALFGGAMMLAMLVILGLHSASATEYTVGNGGGWTLQSTNSVYDDQFKNITLHVGDTLKFPYTAPNHNVYEIPPSDLSSCNFSNSIANYTQSNAVITLATAGTHAFACEVTGHCQEGMQLSVTVNAAAPVPAPSTTPTPAPNASTPTPAPVKSAPAPAPTTPSPAPRKAPSPAPTTTPSPPGVPSTGAAPSPTPAGPPPSAGTVVASGPAMIVGAIVAGFAFLAL